MVKKIHDKLSEQIENLKTYARKINVIDELGRIKNENVSKIIKTS